MPIYTPYARLSVPVFAGQREVRRGERKAMRISEKVEKKLKSNVVEVEKKKYTRMPSHNSHN
jgi:hypothetical protein